MLALITSIKYGVESSKQKIRQEIKKTFKLERRSIMFADYVTLYGENHKNFRNTGENNCQGKKSQQWQNTKSTRKTQLYFHTLTISNLKRKLRKFHSPYIYMCVCVFTNYKNNTIPKQLT